MDRNPLTARRLLPAYWPGSLATHVAANLLMLAVVGRWARRGSQHPPGDLSYLRAGYRGDRHAVPGG